MDIFLCKTNFNNANENKSRPWHRKKEVLSEVRSHDEKRGARFRPVASISLGKLIFYGNTILDQSLSLRMDQKNNKNDLKLGAGKDFR